MPSQALPRQLPQRGSQGLKPITKALGAMRNFPAVHLALPLGELSPQVTERAQGACPIPPPKALRIGGGCAIIYYIHYRALRKEP